MPAMHTLNLSHKLDFSYQQHEDQNSFTLTIIFFFKGTTLYYKKGQVLGNCNLRSKTLHVSLNNLLKGSTKINHHMTFHPILLSTYTIY